MSKDVYATKHILLSFGIQSVTDNVDLIQFLNRLGHSLFYSSQMERIQTVLCLQMLDLLDLDPIQTIDRHTCLMHGRNVDRLQKTISGWWYIIQGQWHIPQVYGPLGGFKRPVICKTNKRIIAPDIVRQFKLSWTIMIQCSESSTKRYKCH